MEETLKRIQTHKGVIGIIVVNNEGKDMALQTFKMKFEFQFLILNSLQTICH